MSVVITEMNLLVLELLARYYLLSRAMIQEMAFPHVRSARSVCERLRKLTRNGFISRANMEVVLRGQNPVPVYYPNKKTAETLAAIHDDPAYENIYCKPPSGRLLFHWLEISRLHYLVDCAADGSDRVTLHRWFNEWEPVNKDAPASQLFSLYSKFDKVSCAPDAGFMVENNSGKKKVFYVEADRGSDSIRRVVSKKPAGYKRMLELSRHLKHFPDATISGFSVLFITTTDYRRDELAGRAAEFDDQGLWKFAAKKEINPDTFFFQPVWHAAGKEPHALITT